MSEFLGIYRESICSPGRHRENDTAIVELVAGELERRGHAVRLASPDEAGRFATSRSTVFSMSRSPRVLKLLARWVVEGRTVVNRPDRVLATARSQLAHRTLGTVAVPRCQVVPTARAARPGVHVADGEWWVKGGDLHASRREDVLRLGTMEELGRVLNDFERRGIGTAVLQQHVPGREIRFYAVGGDFFYWLESDNPAVHGTGGEPFQACAVESGAALSLEIFGGDLVIGEDGRTTLIDLNDWPSFAPCRDAAARAIARHLELRSIAVYAASSAAASVKPSASA
jgi:hypothetical protein